MGVGTFPDSCEHVFITHLLGKSQIQVCSHYEYIDRYFTKVGCVMSLLENIITWFFQISSLSLIIYFYTLLMKMILLVWCSLIHRVKINRRLIYHMRMWLILWFMIIWRQWNLKMVSYVMTTILDVGSNMKCLMPLNIYYVH